MKMNINLTKLASVVVFTLMATIPAISSAKAVDNPPQVLTYYCLDDHWNQYGPFTISVSPTAPFPEPQIIEACEAQGYLGGYAYAGTAYPNAEPFFPIE